MTANESLMKKDTKRVVVQMLIIITPCRIIWDRKDIGKLSMTSCLFSFRGRGENNKNNHKFKIGNRTETSKIKIENR